MLYEYNPCLMLTSDTSIRAGGFYKLLIIIELWVMVCCCTNSYNSSDY